MRALDGLTNTKDLDCGDTYASILDFDATYYDRFHFVLKNTGANSMKYKLITKGSPDGTDEEEVVSEQTLTSGSSEEFQLNNTCYGNLDFQVKNATPGDDTSATLEYTLKK